MLRPAVDIPVHELRRGRPDPRPQQARPRHRRPAERHDPSDVERAGLEQPAGRDDVLHADVPDHLAAVDGVERMDVHADGPGRMHAVENLVADLVARRRWRSDALIRSRADEDRSGGKTRQGFESPLEGSLAAFEDERHVRAQGIGVDGGHEDRVRARRRIGHPAERARAQRRPLARLQEQVPDIGLRHAAGMTPRPRAEVRRLGRPPFAFRPALLDHHRLQRTAGAAMDGPHRPGRRGGAAHSRQRLVLEQELAAGHRVAHRNAHRRPQTDVVGRDQRHVTHRARILDRIGRRSGDGEIQAAGDRVAGHASDPSRIPRTAPGVRCR